MVAGNWKMNNTIEQSIKLAEAVKKETRDIHKVDIVVAPVFTAIKPVFDIVGDSSIQVAGQDVFWEESGAFTGEVSAQMLKDAGCKLVIIGHSERRQFFGETGATVNKKIIASLKAGLRPIVCVGETLAQREAGEAFSVLDRQIEEAFAGIALHDFEKVIIAYEPVWAIGTGKTASPSQADEAHAQIRGKIETLYGANAAQTARILYGGSVKASNAEELFGMANIDGGLIGGASLKTSEFTPIIKAAVNASA
ncbi:MAG: triose-phosphate isomerase [Nitrospinae bacterium]|nr:triose-phosphate isomerase [Nitrospinota bacterium]